MTSSDVARIVILLMRNLDERVSAIR